MFVPNKSLEITVPSAEFYNKIVGSLKIALNKTLKTLIDKMARDTPIISRPVTL